MEIRTGSTGRPANGHASDRHGKIQERSKVNNSPSDLEKQQQGINKQVAADRKANSGKLNASEKKQINKEQNAASRNIYRTKHNAKTQPGTAPK